MDQQPGLKIIRPTAIRTNFSDGFGLQKLGLGQDWVPEKVFLTGFGFLVIKGTKSWFGHQRNRFLPLDFGFYFWLHKTITRQCAYFISCRVGSWVILDGGLGCLDK